MLFISSSRLTSLLMQARPPELIKADRPTTAATASLVPPPVCHPHQQFSHGLTLAYLGEGVYDNVHQLKGDPTYAQVGLQAYVSFTCLRPVLQSLAVSSSVSSCLQGVPGR